MFEIIKVIAESIVKSLSLSDLVEARKKKKAHEIGTELFLLYASLNDILVVGRSIVWELEQSASWMQRKLKEGKPEEHYDYSQAGFLLRQQSMNILKFVASVKRLGLKLQVIAPEVYLRLSPLIHGKMSAINALIKAISREQRCLRLVTVEAEKLLELLKVAEEKLSSWPYVTEFALEDRARSITLTFVEDAMPDGTEGLLVYEQVEDYAPAKQYPIIQAYLNKRNPSAVLDEIESVLKVFREAIEKSFSLRDILLNVGDRRSSLDSPYSSF